MLGRIAAVAALLAATAWAQDDAPNPPPTQGAAGLEGQFVFSQSDGRSKGCAVILLADEAGADLHTVELDALCTSQFEFLADTAGWGVAGQGITLIQKDGSVLIDLQPNAAEPSIYTGTSTLDGRDYYLERTSG